MSLSSTAAAHRLTRASARRGGTLAGSYNVLADNGGPEESKIKILLRDDQPIAAGLPSA